MIISTFLLQGRRLLRMSWLASTHLDHEALFLCLALNRLQALIFFLQKAHSGEFLLKFRVVLHAEGIALIVYSAALRGPVLSLHDYLRDFGLRGLLLFPKWVELSVLARKWNVLRRLQNLVVEGHNVIELLVRLLVERGEINVSLVENFGGLGVFPEGEMALFGLALLVGCFGLGLSMLEGEVMGGLVARGVLLGINLLLLCLLLFEVVDRLGRDYIIFGV